MTRLVPQMARPLSIGPDGPWTPDPLAASSFDELLVGAAASIEANGYALVVTPMGAASAGVNEEVRRVRSLLGTSRVIGTTLALPPLGVAVASALALDAIVGQAPGQALVTVRKMAASLGWFAWVRNPRPIVSTLNLHAGRGPLASWTARNGYFVSCPAGLATPAADVLTPWRVTGAADTTLIPNSMFQSAPLVLSRGSKLPSTISSALEVVENSTLSVSQSVDGCEASYWGTSKVACGIWIPEIASRTTRVEARPEPGTDHGAPVAESGTEASMSPPTCGWCGEVNYHAFCPFCHYCASTSEVMR